MKADLSYIRKDSEYVSCDNLDKSVERASGGFSRWFAGSEIRQLKRHVNANVRIEEVRRKTYADVCTGAS
jgi:hypothetical protein